MSLEADKSIESLQFKIFTTFAALKDILEFIKQVDVFQTQALFALFIQ